jgi:raffinose/stachyose/melibiose transport system substrate-binding protein
MGICIAGGLVFASTAGAQQVTLSYESWSPLPEVAEAMAVATHAKYPDITIKTNVLNYPDYIVDLKTTAASGELPDIVGMQAGQLSNQYHELLLPLQDQATKEWGKNWQSKFFSASQIRLGNASTDENYYSLPALSEVIMLWYNDQLYKEAGFAAPKTYQDYVSQARYFNQKGIAPLVIGAKDGWQRQDLYLHIANNVAPGKFYQAEMGKVKFTDPDLVTAMTFFKKFFDDGIIQKGALGLTAYPGSVEIAKAGNAATFMEGSWWCQESTVAAPGPLVKGMAGFTPFVFPALTDKGQVEATRGLGGADLLLSISKSSKHSAEAFTVIKDWCSGVGAQVLINTLNDMPGFKGVNPEWDKVNFPSKKLQDVWNNCTKWMGNVVYARNLKDPAVADALQNACSAVASGEKTPDEAMQMVQDAWTEPK